TNSAYYYILDGAAPVGPLIKEPTDQTLVLFDYSKLSTVINIIAYTFSPDVSTNPELIFSHPDNSAGNLLSFLVSGGIAGQAYTVAVMVQFKVGTVTSQRTDMFTVSVPSSRDCGCETINPVP